MRAAALSLPSRSVVLDDAACGKRIGSSAGSKSGRRTATASPLPPRRWLPHRPRPRSSPLSLDPIGRPTARAAAVTSAASAAAAAAAAAAKPDVARFLLERLATVIVAPTLAALAVIALTDLLARQAERLIRSRAPGGARSSPASASSSSPPPSPEAAAAAAAVAGASDLAPLLMLEAAVEPAATATATATASEEEGQQQQQQQRQQQQHDQQQQRDQQQQQQHPADQHLQHHHHAPPSAFAETLALLPLALRGPTRVVLLALVATRAVRGLLAITDEAIHTFQPTFGAGADALIAGLCAQLRPLDGALLRLYAASAVLFLTWSAIRLKTLLIARFLRRHEARAAAAAALARRRAAQRALEREALGGGKAAVGGPSSSAAAAVQVAAAAAAGPPPVDLVRLLLPLDEVLSWVLAASAALLIAHNQLGLNLSALVAVGGAGSLVVALGTQQLVSNAVSGLNILLSAPFVVGESVTLVGGGAPPGGISGVVEQVSVVRSRLRTDDDVLVEVPNAALAGMIVYNRSRTDARTRAPTDRLVLRVPLRVRVSLPPSSASSSPAGAAAAAAATAAAAPAHQRCAEALRAVLEGPLARGLVEPHTVSVDVLRLGEGGGLEIFAQATILRDKRAEEEEEERQKMRGGRSLGGGLGGGGGRGGRGAAAAGRARVAELLAALAAVARAEGGKIVQV